MKRLYFQSVKSVSAIDTIAAAAGTTTGTAIDRTGYNSLGIILNTGLITGAPDPASMTFKLYDGTTNNPLTLAKTLTPPTLDKTGGATAFAYYMVDISGLSQYIRVIAVITLTGGSSPKLPISCEFELSDGRVEPSMSVTSYPVITPDRT